MTFTFSLQKVQELKENERAEAAVNYSKAADHFEECGGRLFEALKRKEMLTDKQNASLTGGVTAASLIRFLQEMDYLETVISGLQREAQHARRHMQEKEKILQHLAADVRKYDVLFKKELNRFRSEEKRLERLDMDEISMRQYARKMS
ncbi:flagellar export protein FliJ [Alkalicoccus luteus]|uniref:Flagellar FliJ protein n=1 Tax=Alkalicoccus luteus TaxID=1237094 RepID=A0A969TTU0_9BACI|nr:flagellar export protein FliJ [Alkalicoccus luteus]NJP36352.1 flagellar export protein FliJ [Alkalicoccus luteus]